MTDRPNSEAGIVHDGVEPSRAPASDSDSRPGLLVSRRGALVGGALSLAAVVGVTEGDPESALAAGGAPTMPAFTAVVPLPTTTAPEQLRLAWGADPSTEVTVSWSAPGTVQMPAPTLAWSTSPISYANPGTLVILPAVTPLSLGAPRTGPTATSFTDGLSNQTTYHYHVPLTGLTPNTRYHYQVSDGAAQPSVANGSFATAPSGRAAYRFTAFGDIGTPYLNNPSGYYWKESSDTSVYTMDGVISPGDGNGAGLFHLMLADLSYANANPGQTPAVWRDYQINASRASQNQPWMPIQGNHEVELGICTLDGTPTVGPTAGNFYNGPYGAGNYLARHLLPDNGLTNYDGNSLQGTFYSFQVGTVLFICLDTNDVVWQNPQTVSNTATNYGGTYHGGTIPPGTTTPVPISQYLATGDFVAANSNSQLVPDTTGTTPNLQTAWLKEQLQAARAEGSSVDMIVVCEHHCALSSGPNNGCDMAIRAAWMPLYDAFEVDLVIGGHDHDYERSYPVRGFTPNAGTAIAAFTNPFGTYASGAPVNTLTPAVVTTEPTVLDNGAEAWNTAGGTVFLQLGGAGALAGKTPTVDAATGTRIGHIWASNSGVGATQDATELAVWSANYDSSDNYGYAVFDVDPGDAPGETTLTYRWYQVPSSDESPYTAPTGVGVTMPTTPYEEFVFTRFMPAGTVTIESAGTTQPQVGAVLTAVPSGWPTGATYAYQWLRNGVAISGATGATYTTVAADGGQPLTVDVSVSAQSYPSTSTISPAVNVQSTPPTTTTTTTTTPTTTTTTTTSTTPTTTAEGTLTLALAAIGGTKRVGDVLSIHATEASGASLSYQWLRSGKAISGATQSTYRLIAADASHEVSVTVTATRAGYVTTSATAKAVAVLGDAFRKTSVPTIHGVAIVGRTVTAEVATWTPEAGFAYEWLLNGTAIKGATHRTLKLEPSDAGKKLTVRVTGTRAGYTAHVSTSAHVIVAKTTLSARKPKISGRALVDDTLHAHVGEWPAGTEFSYRWLVGGLAVRGATGHDLRVVSAYRGKRVVLEVTGRLAGHGETRVRSAASRIVRRRWTLL